MNAGDAFGKQSGNFSLRLVNGWHDNVRRLLVGQLDDVLAHVGFQGFDTDIVQGMVQLHLLADHRLALDDRFGVVLVGNLDKNTGGVFRRFGPVHLNTVRGQPSFQLFQQVGQFRQAVLTDRLAQIAHALQLGIVRKLCQAFGLQIVHRIAQTLLQIGIRHDGTGAFAKLLGRNIMQRLCHVSGPPPASPPAVLVRAHHKPALAEYRRSWTGSTPE